MKGKQKTADKGSGENNRKGKQCTEQKANNKSNRKEYQNTKQKAAGTSQKQSQRQLKTSKVKKPKIKIDFKTNKKITKRAQRKTAKQNMNRT